MKPGKLHPILMPAYMEKFACIASECEDTCCAGWRINIDRGTYKRYNQVKHRKLAPLLQESIVRNRQDPTEHHYAYIKLNAETNCPLLTAEKLCGIQQALGEEYLSLTCSMYPRTMNRLNGVIEKSATLSCPAIARLALLDPNGMEFERTAEPIPSPLFLQQDVFTSAPTNAGKPAQYLWELRDFAIEVLQDRVYTVGERLIALGMFCQKLQQYADENRMPETPALIASYKALMANGALKSQLAAIPSRMTFQMELAKELLEIGLSTSLRDRYRSCLTETLVGIGYEQDAPIEEVGQRYQAACVHYYKPFLEEHGYLLENYLVNYVFRKQFPISTEHSVFGAYIVMAVHYALVKLHLIGMSAFHKGMTPDLAVRLIQSLARTVEHNTDYPQRVYELLAKNGYTRMAAMAMLIQDET